MLNVGQKVVCINDTFSPIVKELYSALPVKDSIYVIRALDLGIGLGAERVPKVAVLLVGLVNPCGPPPASNERGFDADRFAPLVPVPDASQTRHAPAPGLIGAPPRHLSLPVKSPGLTTYQPEQVPCQALEHNLQLSSENT
jgi:hypothetical protein